MSEFMMPCVINEGINYKWASWVVKSAESNFLKKKKCFSSNTSWRWCAVVQPQQVPLSVSSPSLSFPSNYNHKVCITSLLQRCSCDLGLFLPNLSLNWHLHPWNPSRTSLTWIKKNKIKKNHWRLKTLDMTRKKDPSFAVHQANAASIQLVFCVPAEHS